jgi:F-type H+-transporting ATPase subunit b
MAAEAKARVTADAEARRQAEEAEVNARITAAEARIAQTRDAAMQNVSTIAADTAQAIVERLTGKPASASEVAAAVKGAA